MAQLADGLVRHADGVVRCWWCGTDPLYVRYHDTEWGSPVTDEVRLFEKMSLDPNYPEFLTLPLYEAMD